MFKQILIANRGEIALRVLRACRELGIETVVAYSEADRDSLPVRLADKRICIGPGPSSKSYLNIPNLISAALLTGCEAIHPGYGFLSENASFAEVCRDVGIVFIGPPPEAIVTMGDKVEARLAMERAGLPMLPGTDVLRTLGEGEAAAARVGFPLMLKAAAGGGGRGIRLVRRPEEFTSIFTTAQSEVREAFHDDGLYIEKYLGRAKHVEVQVLCDNYGAGVYLGERNCSVQRRHQKLVEESPSPGLPDAVRQEMGKRAIEAVLAVGYRGVGTLEFLVDEDEQLLLHGDEYTSAGRAPRDRAGHRHRPGAGADSRRRRRAARLFANPTCGLMVTPSSFASPPKIRRWTSDRKPERSKNTCRPVDLACAWIRTSIEATTSRRTMIPYSRS